MAGVTVFYNDVVPHKLTVTNLGVSKYGIILDPCGERVPLPPDGRVSALRIFTVTVKHKICCVYVKYFR